jgi:hypothetical protein
MGTVLPLKSLHRRPRPAPPEAKRGEIVIFTGVRREWHDLDLGHRMRDSLADDFGGLAEHDHLPRKTS